MIRYSDASFGYGPGEPVLSGVSLVIDSGLTLLLGPNGCGKSTLLKLAAGVERPDSGSVQICGFDLWVQETAARAALAYIPEQPDLTPYATIHDVIQLVCRLRSEPSRTGREVLERVGLTALSKRSIRELSMGQRRRAVVAAAWIGSHRVVLLDEPLESMDRVMRQDILSWIRRSIDGGAAVVVATHEIEPFVDAAARAITVESGLARICDPLPEANRLAFLEGLARHR